jgi:hypothetical protein
MGLLVILGVSRDFDSEQMCNSILLNKNYQFYKLVINMGEIKISVSEKMDKIIQDISDDLGLKKTEFVKNVLINELARRRGDNNGK